MKVKRWPDCSWQKGFSIDPHRNEEEEIFVTKVRVRQPARYPSRAFDSGWDWPSVQWNGSDGYASQEEALSIGQALIHAHHLCVMLRKEAEEERREEDLQPWNEGRGGGG